MTKKWVFIVNPTAGNGYAGKYAEKITEMLNKYDVKAETVFTKRKNHATELAETFIEKGFRYIISVGGDGTANEVARALMNKKDVILGVVSAGTGNDFAQILGFPERFTDNEWDIFFKKNVIGIDVGTCNGNIFLNGMGLGFDAQVAAENYTGENEIKKGGKHKYLWHIIKTLLFYKEKKMTAIVNGERTETDCFIHTIANGRRFAGGFLLTPTAVANDGLLDICLIKKLSLVSRFGILLKVPKGTHIEDKKVNYYQTGQIRLEFDGEVPHHLDGELYFSSTFDVGILPEKLNIIYNPDGNHFFNS
jgi:YegS/Rv2252/BmrU family lipid kinase